MNHFGETMTPKTLKLCVDGRSRMYGTSSAPMRLYLSHKEVTAKMAAAATISQEHALDRRSRVTTYGPGAAVVMPSPSGAASVRMAT